MDGWMGWAVNEWIVNTADSRLVHSCVSGTNGGSMISRYTAVQVGYADSGSRIASHRIADCGYNTIYRVILSFTPSPLLCPTHPPARSRTGGICDV